MTQKKVTTNEPFLANRDGRRVKTLSEVERERRTGYDWYGTWPAELLTVEFPEWRKRVGRDGAGQSKVEGQCPRTESRSSAVAASVSEWF